MLIEQAADLETAADPADLWAGIVSVLRGAQIEHVIYLTVSSDFSGPYLRSTSAEIYTDFPPEKDPFLRYACDSYDIIPLGAAYIESHPYVTEAEKSFVARAARAGLRAGLGIPTRLKGFDRFGGFIIGSDMSRGDFDRRVRIHSEELRLFCLLMHRRMEELTADSPELLPPPFDALSPREKEIVLLLARGHSRQEAAELCEISVHTVSDYAKTAYRKLGIHNRAQAAALLSNGNGNGGQ